MSIEINGKNYRELRCVNCRKLICYEYIFAGRIVYLCPRCGHNNNFNFKHLPTKENDDTIKNEFTMDNLKIKGVKIK